MDACGMPTITWFLFEIFAPIPLSFCYGICLPTFYLRGERFKTLPQVFFWKLSNVYMCSINIVQYIWKFFFLKKTYDSLFSNSQPICIRIWKTTIFVYTRKRLIYVYIHILIIGLGMRGCWNLAICYPQHVSIDPYPGKINMLHVRFSLFPKSFWFLGT